MIDSVPEHDPTPQPQSLFELFVTFTVLALQGFGGVLAVAQRELVDRKRWLRREAFLELYSVAQVLPGPNVVNLALMLGDRFFGWPGALAALGGIMTAPIVIVLTLAASYQQFAELPVVAGALRGMGAVAAGLMIAMAIKLIAALRQNPLGQGATLLLVGVTVALVAVWHVPLVWVVLFVGGTGWAMAFWQLARQEKGKDPE